MMYVCVGRVGVGVGVMFDPTNINHHNAFTFFCFDILEYKNNRLYVPSSPVMACQLVAKSYGTIQGYGW